MTDLIQFFINKSDHISQRTEKIRFLLALLFLFSLPFDIFYSSSILALFVLVTLIDLKKNKFINIPKQFWIFQIPYILSIIGYLYSFNKGEANSILERQLAIFTLPIILPLAIKINDQRKKWLLMILTIGCVVAISFLFFKVFYVIIYAQLPISYFFSSRFFHHQFSEPLAIHAGYLSLFVSMALVFCIQQIKLCFSKFQKLKYLFLCFVLFCGLIFLASRNTIPTTLFILTIIFPLFYIRKKILFISISVISIIILLFAFNKINYLQERFSTNFVSEVFSTNQANFSVENVEPRIERWKGSLELIKKSPIIGYGTGDEILMLKSMYFEKTFYISYLESFNAHNQYLSYLIKNGIIGFMFFLFAISYFLFVAIKKKDFIYLSFLIILSFGFFTENILDANKGIFFFAFLNTFFGYNCLRNLKQKE